MPRRKTAKHDAKRQNNTLATMQQIEKDFSEVPARLASFLKKEIAAHQQKEAKLKNAANKIQVQLKNADQRVKAAAKAKATAAGKKQLNIAKKTYSDIQKSHQETNKQLQDADKTLGIFSLRLSKLTAWNKNQSQFEKEWAKQLKQLKAKAQAKVQAAKAKAKSKMKAKKAKAEEKSLSPIVERQIQPIENFESTIDHVRQDEAAEIAS